MIDLFKLILGILASLVKTRAEPEVENLFLRQQINMLRRRMPKRPTLTNIDCPLFVWLYRWFPPPQARRVRPGKTDTSNA